MSEFKAQFEKKGVSVLPGLLSRSERRQILNHARAAEGPEIYPWDKARFVDDPVFARLGRDERILARLRPLLGQDIILWGSDVLSRAPKAVHPWHCDIESCQPDDGGFVSVWIGLANTNFRSGLKLVTRSHSFGIPVQEAAFRHGSRRGEADDATVLSWAKAIDPEADLSLVPRRDGDAVFFDGRTWHGSCNRRPFATRRALLLQYARADRPVRMFDRAHLDWPLTRRTDCLPPVLVVSGQAPPRINHVHQEGPTR